MRSVSILKDTRPATRLLNLIFQHSLKHTLTKVCLEKATESIDLEVTEVIVRYTGSPFEYATIGKGG